MDEQQPTAVDAVVFINEQPHYELTAPELVFRIETAHPQKPIYFHMAPYSAEAMKTALRGLKPKVKDAGTTILSEEADPAPLYPLFDSLFRGMSNVVLTVEGDSPTLEQQKAWLDRNPRLKARVINEGFCIVYFTRKRKDRENPELQPGIDVNGIPVVQPVVLEDLLPIADIGAKVSYLVRLHSIRRGFTEIVSIAHQFDMETLRDYQVYDRATKRETEKVSGYVSIDVDNDTLERLYDRTILRLEGFVVNGQACTEANKKTWLPLVPYYHKKLALDARFEDVTKKND